MTCDPSRPVTVVGGGLAGCEAAWQLLRRGHAVCLHEMKPKRYSPAHTSPRLAELVCSNSLRAGGRENAVGLLKEEMRRLDSLILEAADATAVPAGRALAVDREAFSIYIEEKLAAAPGFDIAHEEVTRLPETGPAILATGPLTSDALARQLQGLTGREYLAFYDAIAPIILADSMDMSRAFQASRYDEGEGDYINCPMDQETYEAFREALLAGEEYPLHDFEDPRYFEGCLPVEVLARRGAMTLAFGPMKPVGLTDPRTGAQPFAVVQLRRENREGTLLNLVGFQTKLTRPAQEAVFRKIPGLENAEFARYGSIHRNTFLNAPALLSPSLQLRPAPHLLVAGQLSGVEGYVESAAMGLLAGLSAVTIIQGQTFVPPPRTTALGALVAHLTSAVPEGFQPMNVNFGLFEPLGRKIRKRSRGEAYAERALADLAVWQRRILGKD